MKEIKKKLWIGVSSYALVLMLAVLFGTMAFGQNVTATLAGTITDSSGAAVPNGVVTLTNELSGDVRKTVTNSSGLYNFAAVPAGSYMLTVEAKGFSKEEQKGIALAGSQTLAVDMSLKIGATSDTIEVSGAVDQLAVVDSGEKSTNLDVKDLDQIATVGASAGEYMKILPGMVGIQGTTNKAGFTGEFVGINGSGSAGGQSAIGQFTANGNPSNNAMEITSDGAHVSDPGCNCGTPVLPNSTMVQEVHILQAAFSAENAYGPVVMNTTTKAGGSTFHGMVFGSTRNYHLNSNDWYNNSKGDFASGGLVAPRPPNVFYYPGANIGGPVLIPGIPFNKKRDKLFFFSGFEIFLQKENTMLEEAVVPDAAMRGGNFSPAEIATITTPN